MCELIEWYTLKQFYCFKLVTTLSQMTWLKMESNFILRITLHQHWLGIKCQVIVIWAKARKLHVLLLKCSLHCSQTCHKNPHTGGFVYLWCKLLCSYQYSEKHKEISSIIYQWDLKYSYFPHPKKKRKKKKENTTKIKYQNRVLIDSLNRLYTCNAKIVLYVI